MSREIKRIVVHCSASDWGDKEAIDRWHRMRRPPFSMIGYHAVVLNGYRRAADYKDVDDGRLELGRAPEQQGAHVKGHNEDTLGICLVGNRTFTLPQFYTAGRRISAWASIFGIPLQDVLGHYELDPGKDCPCFSMDLFRDFLGRTFDFPDV